jgi:HSP20 family molecular chaperone IbpA
MLVHGNNLEQKEAHKTKYKDEASRRYLREIRLRYEVDPNSKTDLMVV